MNTLAIYIIIASSLTVSFITVMVLLTDDVQIMEKRAKYYLLGKLLVSGTIFASSLLLLSTNMVNAVLWFDACLFALWATYNLYINFKK